MVAAPTKISSLSSLEGLSRADLYNCFISKYDELPKIEELLVEILKGKGVARYRLVFDVGSGTGRLLPLLGSLSDSLMAFEVDADYVKACRSLVLEKDLINVEVVGADFREWVAPSAADLVIMMNGVHYYSKDSIDLRTILAHAYRSLSADGTLLLEGANLLAFLANYGEKLEFSSRINVRDYFIQRNIEHDIDLLRCRWNHHDRYQISKDDQVFMYDEYYSFLISTPEALSSMLREIGFKSVQLFKSWRDISEGDLVRHFVLRADK